jgi:flagellar basal-body rod modification protein FlgD
MAITTSPVTSPLAGLPTSATTISTPPASATSATESASSADRFLKLLVAQMQNQDPLNPMDNAQVTSQMAQINTVNGIEKLNTGLEGLSSQFMQLQVMQGTALVGREVVVPGNHVAVTGGVGRGAFELGGSATSVKVEVKNDGVVVDTVEMGATSAGVHDFKWDASKAIAAGADTSKLTFKVTSTAGGVTNQATALMMDKVTSVSTDGKNLSLQLATSGTVAYSSVKAFN